MRRIELTGRLFKVVVRKEEKGYSAWCVELPAAISQGETIEEVEKNIKEAILLVLEELESRVLGSEDERLIEIAV